MLAGGGDRGDQKYPGVWKRGFAMGTTRSGVVGLAAAFFTLAAAFLFDFPTAGKVAAVELGSGFLDPPSAWWRSF